MNSVTKFSGMLCINTRSVWLTLDSAYEVSHLTTKLSKGIKIPPLFIQSYCRSLASKVLVFNMINGWLPSVVTTVVECNLIQNGKQGFI